MADIIQFPGKPNDEDSLNVNDEERDAGKRACFGCPECGEFTWYVTLDGTVVCSHCANETGNPFALGLNTDD